MKASAKIAVIWFLNNVMASHLFGWEDSKMALNHMECPIVYWNWARDKIESKQNIPLLCLFCPEPCIYSQPILFYVSIREMLYSQYFHKKF